MRFKGVTRQPKSRRLVVACQSRRLGKTRPKLSSVFEGTMDAEFDYDLTLDQWETLKALRVPASEGLALNKSVLGQLIALELAAMSGDRPVITRKGRSVLLRGSPRLL